jgi:CheY-like chemotaxis protein
VAATNGNATTTADPEAPASTPAAASTPSPFLVEANPEASTDDRPQPLTAQNGPRPAGREEFYSGSAAGSTVLIVDDDFRNIFALTALLERGKLEVVAAEGGAVALAVLERRHDIDIVLMDIMMPGMNGYETMKAIRRRPELADLPIIAVTGKVVGGERARCLAAGASGYIPKPVDSAELLQALTPWLPATPRRWTKTS